MTGGAGCASQPATHIRWPGHRSRGGGTGCIAAGPADTWNCCRQNFFLPYMLAKAVCAQRCSRRGVREGGGGWGGGGSCFSPLQGVIRCEVCQIHTSSASLMLAPEHVECQAGCTSRCHSTLASWNCRQSSHDENIHHEQALSDVQG